MVINYNDQYNNAVNAFKRNDIKAAHQLSVMIIKQQPTYTDAYHLLALINIQIHQYTKAAELLKNAISIKNSAKYRIELARTYALLGISDAVVAVGNTLDYEQLDCYTELDKLGVTFSLVGLHNKALRCFELALKKKTTAELLYNFAVSAKFCGELPAAYEALTRALALKPEYYQAHFAISELTRAHAVGEHITVLEQLVEKQNDNIEAVMHLSHALAKEYEKVNDYTAAITTLIKAKEKRSLVSPYNRALDNTLFENLHQTLSSNRVQSQQSSRRPIFVVGMPRSGTTLVERILSGHSDVASGGELEDFGLLLKAASQTPGNSVLDPSVFKAIANIDYNALSNAYLARTAHIGKPQQRFVDKLPFNFFYLPFIRSAFPNAKIICLIRNPLDTCIGNFRQLFSLNNPHYKYTQDLNDCAWFYKQFLSWVQAWQAQDPLHTKIIHYEELTKDPAQKVRELTDFCDLSWQQSCLNIEQNKAPVSTASKMQVRQPINQSSIGRWKRYRPYTEMLEAEFLTQ